jgi:hypothetical protein
MRALIDQKTDANVATDVSGFRLDLEELRVIKTLISVASRVNQAIVEQQRYTL